MAAIQDCLSPTTPQISTQITPEFLLFSTALCSTEPCEILSTTLPHSIYSMPNFDLVSACPMGLWSPDDSDQNSSCSPHGTNIPPSFGMTRAASTKEVDTDGGFLLQPSAYGRYDNHTTEFAIGQDLEHFHADDMFGSCVRLCSDLVNSPAVNRGSRHLWDHEQRAVTNKYDVVAVTKAPGYGCRYNGCHKIYQRREHLKRHMET